MFININQTILLITHVIVLNLLTYFIIFYAFIMIMKKLISFINVSKIVSFMMLKVIVFVNFIVLNQ